jgi:hypothetical protein
MFLIEAKLCETGKYIRRGWHQRMILSNGTAPSDDDSVLGI